MCRNMQYNPADFNQFVLDNDVVGFFENPITLKSGRQSNWYVNWRKVAGDVILTEQLARSVMDFSLRHSLRPDTFYGVPAGATKLAVLTQYLWAKGDPTHGPGTHTLAIGREKPKEHGDPKDKFFVGMPTGRTVLIEDVTTTGGSLLREIEKCLEAREQEVAAIGLTNRMELNGDRKSVEQLVKERGIPYFAMSNAPELLPLAYKRLQPGRNIGLAIEKEFVEFGVQPVRLVSL